MRLQHLFHSRQSSSVPAIPEFLLAAAKKPLENRFCLRTLEQSGQADRSRLTLRGFLISSAVSIVILAAAILSLNGIVTLFLILYGVIQFTWTLLLFTYYRYNDQPAQARGALFSCALNLVLYLAGWAYVLPRLVF